jgi:hypothetical protein
VAVIHDSGDSDCLIRTGILGWGHRRLGEVRGLYLKKILPSARWQSISSKRWLKLLLYTYTWLQCELASVAEKIWCIAFRSNRSLTLDEWKRMKVCASCGNWMVNRVGRYI